MSAMETEVTPVPSPFDVRDTLEGLFGRDVDVRIGDPYSPEIGEQTTYAVYVDDLMRTRAVAVGDLPFSAYAGAAIALVPPAGAESTIAGGCLDDMMAENLYEVLNVCASVLNGERSPHVKLHAVYAAGSTPPSDIIAFASVPGRRVDLVIDIARYGRGRFSVIGVA